MRYNNRNLATVHHTTTTKVLDNATRAMLAVFISYLLLVLPHSIYHTLPFEYKVIAFVIMHSYHYLHLFVEPTVFIYFNKHHRRRVVQAVKSCRDGSPIQEVASSLPTGVSRSTPDRRVSRIVETNLDLNICKKNLK